MPVSYVFRGHGPRRCRRGRRADRERSAWRYPVPTRKRCELVRSYLRDPGKPAPPAFRACARVVGHRRLSAADRRGLTRKPGHATSDRVAGPGAAHRRTRHDDMTTASPSGDAFRVAVARHSGGDCPPRMRSPRPPAAKPCAHFRSSALMTDNKAAAVETLRAFDPVTVAGPRGRGEPRCAPFWPNAGRRTPSWARNLRICPAPAV